MRVVVQRSEGAQVEVAQEVIGRIGNGFVILVGVTHDDTTEDVQYLADKISHLRIFEDEQNKMNLSLLDTGGEILSISQFTLYADCSKGRRPSFKQAAKPDHAEALYEQLNQAFRDKGIEVQTGEFGAMMNVSLNNHGPVTLVIDSRDSSQRS